jgi:Cu/Ag efflux protein CusF
MLISHYAGSIERGRYRAAGIALALFWASVAGCTRSGDPGLAAENGPPHQSEAQAKALRNGRPPRRTETDYTLRGTVTKVEAELKHVRIAHEEIPGFMNAMTMRFAYADRAFLAGLHQGDAVEGTLRVVREDGAVIDYELLGLEVKKPASGPRLVLGVRDQETRSRRAGRRLHHDHSRGQVDQAL